MKRENLIHPHELAEQACHIEIERLREPIGKQDQYIASFGGVTCFRFCKNGSVEAWPLKISNETLLNLEDNLVLFFTGLSRSASSILREQDTKSKQGDGEMINNLHKIKELGIQTIDALEKGNLESFAELMNVHWRIKKQRSSGMTNHIIDDLYETALHNGALGGKVIGAGGGGFLLFYANDKPSLRKAMKEKGLKEIRFKFDFEGTKLLASP